MSDSSDPTLRNKINLQKQGKPPKCPKTHLLKNFKEFFLVDESKLPYIKLVYI